ncbi:hypothetical protein SEA_ZENTIME222_53 [Mycobacterium phage ZenTime222]|nr:hypothetical protein SEA_ZENTIME222_53 [Mycobacterium phage ZenTime222]
MRTEDDYMNDHPEHRADHSHRERSALVERHKDGHVMSPREKVAELERELEHASAIAACSIGQPDRAANVAYREEVRAKLEAARAAADNPAREKVAEAIRYTLAIHPWGRDLPYPFSEYVERLKLEIADAAIAAHMEALKDEGHVMVKLPEPGCDEWGDMVIEVPITDQKYHRQGSTRTVAVRCAHHLNSGTDTDPAR